MPSMGPARTGPEGDEVMDHALAAPGDAAARAAPPMARPLALDDVVLHRLRSPAEVEEIVHLRDEIDLSVHAAAGPQFGMLEKKETSAGSCAGSRWAASGSARSASSR
jgi:hypothetical protein